MCQEIGKCNAFQACDFVARLTKTGLERKNMTQTKIEGEALRHTKSSRFKQEGRATSARREIKFWLWIRVSEESGGMLQSGHTKLSLEIAWGKVTPRRSSICLQTKTLSHFLKTCDLEICQHPIRVVIIVFTITIKLKKNVWSERPKRMRSVPVMRCRSRNWSCCINSTAKALK